MYPDLPVLLSNMGVFTFPDTIASAPGSYVGVVLSSRLPVSDRARFHEHLSQLTLLRVQVGEKRGIFVHYVHVFTKLFESSVH